MIFDFFSHQINRNSFIDFDIFASIIESYIILYLYGEAHTNHLGTSSKKTFIKEIVRKSDVNWEINLPVLAVVGSQSTGN